MGHSCRACIEWNCSVSSIQTAGLYFVPILIILRDTENLEGVVLFRIFLTAKDIIIIAGVKNVVLLFFIGNEGLSILENASNCGLPVPKKLKDTLAQFTEIKAKK